MWRLISLILIGLWSLSAPFVMAQTLSGITLTLGKSDTTIALEGQGVQKGSPLPTPNIFMIDGKKPRIVVDFAKAKANLTGRKGAGGQTFLDGAGHISGIRFASRGTSGLRLVFDLSPEAKLHTEHITDSHSQSSQIVFKVKGKILTPKKRAVQPAAVKRLASLQTQICQPIPCPRLAPHINIVAPSVKQTVSKMAAIEPVNMKPLKKVTKPRYFGNKTPFPRLKSFPLVKTVRPHRRPVIVIDPGHGGRDPGAIGTRKTREKDITFKASLQLRKELLKSGRYDVILTRTQDTYIEHSERLRIARAGGADLFISVHADSTRSKTARGASVYTLADRAKKRSKKIVSTQNWIMDVDLDQQSNSVGDILVDLAQRKTATQSDAFADILLDELEGATKLIGNSHRKAGYFVLLAPDVPAVLLELGFLSNPDDEKLLKTKTHRAKIMRSVSRAIDTYFKQAGL